MLCMRFLYQLLAEQPILPTPNPLVTDNSPCLLINGVIDRVLRLGAGAFKPGRAGGVASLG